jgi:hypothetical protein
MDITSTIRDIVSLKCYEAKFFFAYLRNIPFKMLRVKTDDFPSAQSCAILPSKMVIFNPNNNND